jgi:uncharacterized membrane protein YraQ (UPF0718 family)
MASSVREFFAALIGILNESSPYLVLGFALAGLMHVLLDRFPRITAQLTRPGKRPLFLAALLGVPMPLCSCSVLPAALALRRQGASKGTTATFLVSEPETDVVSILVTFALIGPFVGVYRPLAAIAAALATGLVIHAVERRELRPTTAPAPATLHHGSDACCDETHVLAEASSIATAPTSRRAAWWSRSLRYGFIEIFDDIVPQLFLGIMIAALIGVLLPEINPRLAQGHAVLSYLIMVVVGIPVYVCAAASTPIAAGLIAAGVSPGAAMVFLLAGPATNLGSLFVLRGVFGARLLAVYVLMIAASSIALGALLDLLVGSLRVTMAAPVHEHGASPLAIACTLALLVWTVLSFHRSRLIPRMRDGLIRLFATRASER